MTTFLVCPLSRGGSVPCCRGQGLQRRDPVAAAGTAEVGRPGEGATADEAGDAVNAVVEEREVLDAAATTGDATKRWQQLQPR